MRLILSQILPNCYLKYSFNNNFFQHLYLRPNRGPQLIIGKNIRIQTDTANNALYLLADSIKLYTKNFTNITMKNVKYHIHQNISVEQLKITIKDFSISINSFYLTFQPQLQFKFKNIQLQNYITIQRFDKNLPIEFNLSKPIILRIPEIRIFQRPSIQTLKQWKESIIQWIPNDESDEPMPEIHLSSLFIRHVPTGWFRCISPISIGANFKNFWQIWEHIIRAVIRI